MAEAQNVENVVTPEVEEQNTHPVENSFEDRARQMGWRPMEEYDGDKSRWVDAREFILRGELYDRMHQQSRQVKEMQKAMQSLIEHNRKVEEMAYKRAIQDLTAAKKAALDQGDSAAVVEIDNKILEARDQMNQQAQQTTQQAAAETPPEYFEFASANPWYTKDRAMTAFADSYGQDLVRQGYPVAQIYKMVEQEVKKEFAHKFQRPAAAAVVDAGSQSGKAASGSKFAPTKEEQELAAQFVRYGVFKTKEDYYKQLKASKGGN